MAVSLATVVGEVSPLTITAGMAEPAGARVPGPHRTVGVEPDDLVVGDAVDHLLEATQRDLLHEPLGQVSDNLDVSRTTPSLSWIGLRTTDAQNRVPSLRTRQPSVSYRAVSAAVRSSTSAPVHAAPFGSTRWYRNAISAAPLPPQEARRPASLAAVSATNAISALTGITCSPASASSARRCSSHSRMSAVARIPRASATPRIASITGLGSRSEVVIIGSAVVPPSYSARSRSADVSCVW